MSGRCQAGVWNDPSGRGWDRHQCTFPATTTRTIQRLTTGSREIPVCRMHLKQRRYNFVVYGSFHGEVIAP